MPEEAVGGLGATAPAAGATAEQNAEKPQMAEPPGVAGAKRIGAKKKAGAEGRVRKTPEAVVGILIYKKDGEILLVKGPKWANKYAIPGGHIEYGEKMVDTVRREALEETGLKVKKIEPIRSGEFVFSEGSDSYDGHYIYTHFSCMANEANVRLNEEADSCVWVSPKDALRLNLAKFTRDTIVRFIGNKRKSSQSIYTRLV